MTTYTSDDVRNAEEVLAVNLGLSNRIARFARSLGKIEEFNAGLEDDSLDLGTLLIAAARRDLIHFMQAHTVLVEELRYQAEQRGEHLPYDSAVQSAYDILDEYGVITDERIADFKQKVIPRLAEDLSVALPEESKKVIDFYEARARLRAKSQEA
jgi:hypothetical protein